MHSQAAKHRLDFWTLRLRKKPFSHSRAKRTPCFLDLKIIQLSLLCSMFLGRVLSKSAYIRPPTTTMFKQVCLGGTFDDIHTGHKLLFNEAIKICNQRLVVGVTDMSMIKSKTLWELISPVEDRINKVREYLVATNASLEYSVVPISDIYGPTILERDLECIVVSNETVRGAHKINEARLDKGWPKLEIRVIDLLEDTDEDNQQAIQQLAETKISSSVMRLKKLGTVLREPLPNNSIPNRPYLIGLTGGIASGKTTIGEYLKTFGFGYINYDSLGHQTYSTVGSPVYNQIVEFFGESAVLNETTKQIDRPKLGKIVFADKSKLDKLNGIVWPAIYALVDQEIERLKAKHDVIILESALLVESNQTSRVHQVWTSIVSPEESTRRQMHSRGLSKEEAEKRLSNQLDNWTRVQKSNVVFCTQWSEQVTRQQVDRCVKELREKYLINTT